MAKIKEERIVTIYTNITYRKEKDFIVQTFSFSTKLKKDLSYLYDSRFLIKDEVEKIIRENLLKKFEKRVDYDDKIEMYYTDKKHPAPCIKAINIYMPPYQGCAFCKKAQSKDGYIFCSEKTKHYPPPGIKRCVVFETKPKLLT